MLGEESRAAVPVSQNREFIINKLKERGCRITKQRRLLIDIILENDCRNCKEIVCKAALGANLGIGVSTVYRMVSILEEIGAIERQRICKLPCIDFPAETADEKEPACLITLKDGTMHLLSDHNWNDVITTGLKACGYLNNGELLSITPEIRSVRNAALKNN